MDQDSLRAAIGMVAQQAALLNRSVKENILLGRTDVSDEQLFNATALASADTFIEGLRDGKGREGYEAHVGERGVKLSGGQRQRVAIARVILEQGTHEELKEMGGLYASFWGRQSGGFIDTELE